MPRRRVEHVAGSGAAINELQARARARKIRSVNDSARRSSGRIARAIVKPQQVRRARTVDSDKQRRSRRLLQPARAATGELAVKSRRAANKDT